MKKSIWLQVVLAVILSGLIIFKPSLGWKFKKVLEFDAAGSASSSAANLALENETLKAELAKLKSIKDQLPIRQQNYLRAIVYSGYPTNFKNEILISVGEKDGVLVGNAVTFGGVLIGKIEKVMSDTSLVETIFDGRLELAARIGSYATEALVRGGPSPDIALIPLNSSVSEGDVVYSASPDLPYALPIGEVGQVKVSSDKLFKEALLRFIYDLNEIKTVLVEKK